MCLWVSVDVCVGVCARACVRENREKKVSKGKSKRKYVTLYERNSAGIGKVTAIFWTINDPPVLKGLCLFERMCMFVHECTCV